jgi:uncharacterized membrane protein YraQ (UPF0718 family)
VIGDTALLVVELVALFFGVAFMVHLTQRRLGPEKLRNWMGGTPLVAALKGIAIGFITPFCTFSAIPLLVGFRQAGVTPAGYVAFIVAAPVLDPILFGALALIAGIEAALVYLAVAFTAALSLALIAEAVGIDRHLKPLPASLELAHAGTASNTLVHVTLPVDDPGDASECTTSCETTSQGSDWRGLTVESRAAAGAAVGLLRTMGPLLLLGVGIGLAIETLVSPEMVGSVAGAGNPLAIPTAAALNAGVGIGAIVALTIAGAGANLPEFVLLSKLANRRLIGVVTGFVLTVAITGGFLASAIVV